VQISVKLFAVLRERAGSGEVPLSLSDPATVSDVRDQLVRDYPQLANLIDRVAFAVNRNYADLQTPVHEGDEVAALPPVSGG